MATIPKTNARLSLSASIYVNLTDTATFSLPTSGTTGGWVRIGSVEKFDEENPRTTSPRYELNFDQPGEIQERIPALVERTLSMSKVVMYNEDLMKVFGSASLTDIIDQNVPFSLAKVEKMPTSTATGTAPEIHTTIYSGCWLHDNSKSYDITRELKMVQQCKIGYVKRTYSVTSQT